MNTAAPSRGANTVAVATYIAPSNPPHHAHAGSFAKAMPCGHDGRVTSRTTPTATVLVSSDQNVASIASPIVRPSSPLAPACTGRNAPTNAASNTPATRPPVCMTSLLFRPKGKRERTHRRRARAPEFQRRADEGEFMHAVLRQRFEVHHFHQRHAVF